MLTFPDKYVKIIVLQKDVSLPGDNDVNVDFTSEIVSAGYSLDDVLEGMCYGYVPYSTWATQLINRGMVSSGVIRFHTLGATTQTYQIQGLFL